MLIPLLLRRVTALSRPLKFAHGCFCQCDLHSSLLEQQVSILNTMSNDEAVHELELTFNHSTAGLNFRTDESESLPKLVNKTTEVNAREWATLSRRSSQAVLDAVRSKRFSGRDVFWRNHLPIWNPYSKLYWCWCTYVLLMDATYTAFVVPIAVAFDTSNVAWDWAGYLDFIAGCTFAIELFLGWNVAYVATHNLQKRVILKRRKIAQFYVFKGSFIFDLISTIIFVAQAVGYGIGLAGQSGGTVIQIIQIARALRLFRLLGLLQQLFVLSLSAPQRTLPIVNKPIPTWLSYLLQLLYLVALIINFTGCVLVFVAEREGFQNTWVNNYSPFVSNYAADASASVLTTQEARTIPGPIIYLAAAYWALTTITTIGFGDVTPIRNAERATLLFIELMGVLFFGILLGSITSLLQRASAEVKDAQMFHDKMTAVEKWMTQGHLPHELRIRIRRYYAQVWVHEAHVRSALEMFQDLPQELQGEVAWFRIQNLMKELHTFQDLDSKVQRMIAMQVRPLRVGPGHHICSQGSPADSLWLLQEGSVVTLQHQQEGQIQKAPTVLGVTALLASDQSQYKNHPFGYRALNSCVLWELCMTDLQPLFTWQQDVAIHLASKAQEHFAHSMTRHSLLQSKSGQPHQMNGSAELKQPPADAVPAIVSPFLTTQNSATQGSDQQGLQSQSAGAHQAEHEHNVHGNQVGVDLTQQGLVLISIPAALATAEVRLRYV